MGQKFDWARPSYPIDSVDNALRLLQMLRDEGPLKLSEAAEALDIAQSTAHRLLAMLVYRGFAVRRSDRLYHAGPAMGARPLRGDRVRELRELAHPHLQALSAELGHTSNLFIRIGPNVRTILTVESSGEYRVGDRRGIVFPVTRASGGKVLIAHLSREELERMFRGPSTFEVPQYLSESRFEALLQELKLVRLRGYGVNEGDTESGVFSLSMPIVDTERRPVAAFGVSIPRKLFHDVMDHSGLSVMAQTRDELAAALRDRLPAWPGQATSSGG